MSAVWTPGIAREILFQLAIEGDLRRHGEVVGRTQNGNLDATGNLEAKILTFEFVQAAAQHRCARDQHDRHRCLRDE